MKEQSKEQKHRTKKQEEAVSNDNSAGEEKVGEEKEEKTYRLNTGALPAIMMLTGGALSSIVTFINHYTLAETLKIVFLSLIAFYLLGVVIKKIFDSFHITVKKKAEDSAEGEVIEKDPNTSKEETSEASRE